MSADLDRVPQAGLQAAVGDHEEIGQVNVGVGTGTRGSGGLGIESGLGYLAQVASQAGELVEGGVTLGDLVLGEVLAGRYWQYDIFAGTGQAGIGLPSRRTRLSADNAHYVKYE
jgi:hypothetical protein